MGRINQSDGLRDDLPLMPSLSDFYGNDQGLSRTMFTIIRDELVGYIISAIVLPTDSVYGLIEYGKQIPWPE